MKTMNLSDLSNLFLSVLTDDGHLNTNASYKKIWGDEWKHHLIRVISRLHEDILRTHVTEGNDKIGYTLNFSIPALYTCSKEACETCGKGACYALSEERYPAVVISRYENLNLCVKDPERLEREINAVITKAKQMRYFRDKNGKTWSERALRSELKHRKDENPEQYKKSMRLKAFIEELELVEIDASEVKVKLHFRLHESGDFYSVAYLDMWLRIAEAHPDVVFYTYTKQFDVIRKRAAEILAMPNFTIKLSAWTGLPLPQDLIDMGFHVAYCDDGIEDRIPKNAFACPATAGNDMTCERCGYVCAKNCDVCFHLHGNGAAEYLESMAAKNNDKAVA